MYVSGVFLMAKYMTARMLAEVSAEKNRNERQYYARRDMKARQHLRQQLTSMTCKSHHKINNKKEWKGFQRYGAQQDWIAIQPRTNR